MIVSPCISICKTDPDTGFCYGCGRTDEEKTKWKLPDTSDEWKNNNLKILKTDIDKYMESDPELVKLKQKVEYVSTVIDFLESTIKQISNRGFQIKNAIDWRKFTSGAI